MRFQILQPSWQNRTIGFKLSTRFCSATLKKGRQRSHVATCCDGMCLLELWLLSTSHILWYMVCLMSTNNESASVYLRTLSSFLILPISWWSSTWLVTCVRAELEGFSHSTCLASIELFMFACLASLYPLWAFTVVLTPPWEVPRCNVCFVALCGFKPFK